MLSIGAAHPYLRNENDAVRISRALNDAYAALMTHAATQFASFGVLPLPHVDAALDEIDRIPDLPGFAGIALGASAQHIPIDDLTFAP